MPSDGRRFSPNVERRLTRVLEIERTSEVPLPFVSVIVTAYHRRSYLAEAVRSVLDQDFPPRDFEVIVLKDFADAEIDAVLERSAPPVRVYTETLGGMGAMFARGIELARGEVVAFLEDDDRYREGKLRGIAKIFTDDSEIGFVRNSYRGIDALGRPLPSWDRHRPQAPGSVTLSPQDRARETLAFVFHHGVHVNLSTMAIRRNLVHPWLESMREITAVPDLFLFVVAAVSGKPFRVESAVWNEYRVHQSTSHADLSGGSAFDALAETARSSAAGQVMLRIIGQAPGHPVADRFVASFTRELAATLYLLDPAARWSVRGWLGFLRTIAWRRQRYLLDIALFAVYRAVAPRRAASAYRKWRSRALRVAAGSGP